MRALLIRPIAAADIDEAHAWYAARSPKAAARFLDTVSMVLAEIEARPESFPLVHRSVRRALMPGHPFGVYFTLADDRITVLAVVHSRRHPRRWQRRA